MIPTRAAAVVLMLVPGAMTALWWLSDFGFPWFLTLVLLMIAAVLSIGNLNECPSGKGFCDWS